MALNLFPTTTHVSWSVLKAPNWATRMQRSVIGRELTISDYVIPIYTFTLNWELLRDKWDVRTPGGRGAGFDELRQIWGFYNVQQGSAIPFRFQDVSDNTTRINPAVASPITIAFGDGVTTSFLLVSPLSAAIIPDTIYSINLNGTPTGAYTIDSNLGVINFTSPPGAGVTISADYTYFYRVRFNTDGLEAENFALQFWQMKTLKLISKIY